jgi:hypothetical protein
MKWGKHVASMDRVRNENKILAWKSEAKTSHERSSYGWWIILKLILRK